MREKCPNTEVFLVRTFPRKEAHAAINSALPLVSLAEERSSSSRMFMYWMTILKLKIDYLVFIRSMTKDNFNVFVKILISLVKCFFIFDHYNSARSLSVHIQDLLNLPITCLNSINKLKKEILWYRFQTDNFHEFILTKLINKVKRQLSLS